MKRPELGTRISYTDGNPRLPVKHEIEDRLETDKAGIHRAWAWWHNASVGITSIEAISHMEHKHESMGKLTYIIA